ncbi:hypothetical protein [Brasilonema sp. UFV-L1]|uniref:hypothetical protein n=1 Tax=Brasilonema sp. UFV-L1 TaxID=2234130 RepID=UPI00145D441E|nr:hypothetical protein [Brasilonema sp. UFV-L1]NMG10826.1 hypothetical protein [Brasilonema sp. UFV-L1]
MIITNTATAPSIDFYEQYKKLCLYFNRPIPESDILSDIQEYIYSRLSSKELACSVKTAILTCSEMPTPKQLVALIKGTEEENAIHQWHKITTAWENSRSGSRFTLHSFAAGAGLDDEAIATLTMLGFERSSHWVNLYENRQEFVKLYSILRRK